MGLLDLESDDTANGLNAVAAAVQGFLKGRREQQDFNMRRDERDENRKFREMEFQARVASEKEKREREERLEKAGKEKDVKDRVFKGFSEGYDTSTFDEQGMPTANTKFRPDFLALKTKTDRASADPYGVKFYAAEKAKADYEARQKEKTPQGKVMKLSGDLRKRFDDTTGSLDALIDVENAFNELKKNGKNQDFIDRLESGSQMMGVPLRGDTDYTASANRFKEFIGRLQSGGAIGTQEAKDFIGLIPTAFDEEDVARKKISEIKFRLGSRLRGFDMSPDEAAQGGFIKPGTAKGLLTNGLIEEAAVIPPGNTEAAAAEMAAKRDARIAELERKKAQGGRSANGTK